MFVELHMLQNFAPSNLNRDESNSPKDCTFGGVRRARISSQCIKRSIRMHDSFKKAIEVPLGHRSKLLATKLEKAIEREYPQINNFEDIVKVFVAELIGGIDTEKLKKDNIPTTKAPFFFSETEVDEIAKIIVENYEEMSDIVKKINIIEHVDKKFSKKSERKLNKYIEKLLKNKSTLLATSSPDIAMFGRMLANESSLNMIAACQVAHAISTHRVGMEFDFFTAIDDLQPEDEIGAAMMGLIGFNAATYYRYSNINIDQLITNLDGDMDLVTKTIRGFLEASVKALPTGKQNSFAALNPPSFVMAVVRKNGATWSLANAFEKPVFAKGNQSLLEASIIALDNYWGEIDDFFNDNAKPLVSKIGIKVDLPNLGTQVIPQLKTWIDTTLDEVSKG